MKKRGLNSDSCVYHIESQLKLDGFELLATEMKRPADFLVGTVPHKEETDQPLGIVSDLQNELLDDEATSSVILSSVHIL